PSAGGRDRAAPCCGAHGRRGSPALWRAIGGARRRRAQQRRSWDLLPIAQRTESTALRRRDPEITPSRQLALPLRLADAQARGLVGHATDDRPLRAATPRLRVLLLLPPAALRSCGK